MDSKISFKQEEEIIRQMVDEMSSEERLKYAKIGMIALVDEATGYQKDRPKDELREIKKKLDK